MNPPDDAITALCQRYRALILQHDADRLRVAVAESVPPGLSEALHFASQCQIEIECWPQARLDQRQHADTGRVAREETPAESAIEAAELILRQALERRASDVHIEPGAEGMRVRLRIDGVLHPLSSLPVTQPAALLARLKILGGLDIAERRLPQDGQFSLAIAGQSASFRLATLPVYGGEKAVIRLLQSESAALSLDKLGLPPAQLRLFTAALAQPQGLILVTGPTGSGKTFTLYSGLSALNRPEKNLCSVEDPIEIPLSGINQTQIHNRKGLDFNRVLRALLRQDPDVIMVGEIRDAETAEIAVKAAQTGHLVLSTAHQLHRRDADAAAADGHPRLSAGPGAEADRGSTPGPAPLPPLPSAGPGGGALPHRNLARHAADLAGARLRSLFLRLLWPAGAV